MSTLDPPRARDAERSRTRILDAAERLFAAHGYTATSLQDIGAAAGVSRGTPSYFFGSKEGVYRAVLERNFAGVGGVIRRIREESLARGDSPDTTFRREIEGYIDFLTEHPTFVRLVQWEAVTGGRILGEFAPHLGVALETLEGMREDLGRGAFRPVDPLHLLLSVMALAWFPLTQKDTLLKQLGMDPFSTDFTRARKEHVVDLLLNGLVGEVRGKR